jgi:hypothetical protein
MTLPRRPCPHRDGSSPSADRLAYHEWETAGGVKRHDYEVVGNVEFLVAPRGDRSQASKPAVAVVS